ncbi:MAG: hypothetical protein P8Y70_18140 [Candidatus Lokiarchaeota archaeon]
MIQISQDEILAFDTSHIRTIIYNDDLEGAQELTENIKKYIDSIEREITINGILEKLENSWDYADAINNTKELSEYQEELVEYQIERIRRIIEINDQVSESYAMVFLLIQFLQNCK